MSNGSVRRQAEETFARQKNAQVGTDAAKPLTAHLTFNNSDDLNSMSKKLRDYYDNFNETNHIIVGIYIPTILIAVVANILVIVVILKNKYLRSVTNYFIVNLSVSDLLVAILCMPMGISQAISITWSYGMAICKLSNYLQGVAVMASIFTMTAMSIDRYLAINKPVALGSVLSHRTAIIIIVAIWLGSFIIFSPVLAAVTLRSFSWANITLAIRRDGIDEVVEVFHPPTLEFCSEEFDSLGLSVRAFGASCFVIAYVLPVFIIIGAYSRMGRTLCSRKPPFDSDSTRTSACSQQGFRLLRERKRVAWFLFVMAILFALCWLPYNVLRLLVDFAMVDNSKGLANGLSYCLFLGHTNSALNPAVFCLMTRNFRRNIYELLCCCCSATRSKTDRKQVRTAPKVTRQRASQWNPFISDQSPNNASKRKPEDLPMRQLLPLAPSASILQQQAQIHRANENSSPQKSGRIMKKTEIQDERAPDCEIQRTRSYPDLESARNYDAPSENRYNSQ